MRRTLSCLLVLLLLFTLVPVFAAGTVTVTIDGVPVSYDQSSGVPFIDENDRTQVPLRRTMEFFGCGVSWNPLTRTAAVKKNKTSVSVPIGKDCIQVGKEKIPIDTAAQIRDGRTYLPIRAAAEAFGATVTWDADTQTVVILTGANSVRVHFIDVGQGDATLIDCGTTEVLIDGGPKDAGSMVADYLRPYVDGRLDVLIATHPDADHIGGLAAVLAAYDVEEVIDSGYPGTSWAYRTYWEAAQAELGCTVSCDSDRTISLGDNTSLTVIETGDNWDNANDSRPKTRPDSPVPSLQGPCDWSLKSEVPCGSCLNWR